MHLQLELKRRALADEGVEKMRDKVERLNPDSTEREAVYRAGLEDIIKSLEELGSHRPSWDFSREKAEPVFVSDGNILLRPINAGDIDFYWTIKERYSLFYRNILRFETHKKESMFLVDAFVPESFYCVIEANGTPIGLVAIQNTEIALWELSVELDGKYTQRGYGPRSIKLFLNEVSRITGKTQYRAKVMPDNIPSQKCFEKIGAELVGMCEGGYVRLPEEQARFEEEHMDLIDDHIRELAARISVEPKKLLTHVLDYRLECPL